MPDYVPRQDGGFSAWMDQFAGRLTANPQEYGLDPADVLPLAQARDAWSDAFAEAVTAQAAAHGAREKKAAARESLEEIARELAGRLQSSKAIDDTKRQALGITVRDRHRTPVPAPATAPVGTVSIERRLAHTLRFFNGEAIHRRAKPAGVYGCEVWVKIGGTPPDDPSELHYVAVATRTPFVVEHDPADAGKAAHYMLRWIGTKGRTGPWSPTVSATIVG